MAIKWKRLELLATLLSTEKHFGTFVIEAKIAPYLLIKRQVCYLSLMASILRSTHTFSSQSMIYFSNSTRIKTSPGLISSAMSPPQR